MDKNLKFLIDPKILREYRMDLDNNSIECYDIVFISTIVDIEKLRKIKEISGKIRSKKIIDIKETSDGKYYILLIEKIDKVMELGDEIENYETGFLIGKDIRDYHDLQEESNDNQWPSDYLFKIDHLYHEYGIRDYRGAKDYILIDILNSSKYLLKVCGSKEILIYDDMKNLQVDAKSGYNLLRNARIECVQPYYIFKDINETAKWNPEFATGLIDGYFKGDTPLLFFKYLAIYTITENMHRIVVCEDKNDEAFYQETEKIIEIYNEFSDIRPIWYLDCRERLNHR